MLRQIVGLKVIPLPLAVGKSKVRLNVRPFSADSRDSEPFSTQMFDAAFSISRRSSAESSNIRRSKVFFEPM
jgi:hypothetical protein